MARDICVINAFQFICHDMATTKYIWKDIHLHYLGTRFLSKNFIESVNNYLFSIFYNRF